MGHVELHGGGLAARADAAHREAVLAGVVQADAAEIHRQFFLEPRDHHLENAAQVLAFADGTRDARQQRQPLQLFREPGFVRQPLGDVAIVGDDGPHRRIVEQVGGDSFEPHPVPVLVALAPDHAHGFAGFGLELCERAREYRHIVGVRVHAAALADQFLGRISLDIHDRGADIEHMARSDR